MQKIFKLFKNPYILVKLIRIAFIILFILVPLAMSSKTSEIFEFNKMMIIYFTTTLVTPLFLIHYILHKPKLVISKLFIPLGVFLAVIVISTLFSIDMHTSVYGYYGRWNGGLFSILSYLLLFFVFLQTHKISDIKLLFKISVITSAIVLIWGLLSKFGIDFSCLIFTGDIGNSCWTEQFQPSIRMFSTLGQPNWLGTYLAIHFFIAGYFAYDAFINCKSKMRNLFVIFLISNLIGVVFTKSRSSILAVFFSISIGLISYFTQRLKSKTRVATKVLSISALLIFIMVGTLTVSSNIFQKDVPKNLVITDSMTIRSIVWKGAIALGNQYPVLGTGPETFAYSYFFTKPASHNMTSEWDFVYNKAHNEFLNYLSTTGYLGLISYILLIGTTVVIFIKEINKSKINSDSAFIFACFLSFLSILVTNFFGFSTSATQVFFYTLPAVAVIFNRKIEKDPKLISKSPLLNIRSKLFISAVAIVTMLSLFQIVQYYRADRIYAVGKGDIQSGDYKAASVNFNKALSLRFEHVYEDALSSSLAHLAFLVSFEDKANALKLIDSSKSYNAHTLKTASLNYSYWRTRAKNYYLYFQVSQNPEDLKQSVDSMKYFLEFSKTDATQYYMTALFSSLVYNETGLASDKADTIKYLDKALELKPDYIEAKTLLESVTLK